MIFWENIYCFILRLFNFSLKEQNFTFFKNSNLLPAVKRKEYSILNGIYSLSSWYWLQWRSRILAHSSQRSCRGVFPNHFSKMHVRSKIFTKALLVCSPWFNWLLLKGEVLLRSWFLNIISHSEEPGMFEKWLIWGRGREDSKAWNDLLSPHLRKCSECLMGHIHRREKPACGGSQGPNRAIRVWEERWTIMDYNPLNEISLQEFTLPMVETGKCFLEAECWPPV